MSDATDRIHPAELRARTPVSLGARGFVAQDQALAAFRRVRETSLALARPLEPEDQCIQSMPDVSPTKWHLAHTSWFFENFLLMPHSSAYRPFDPGYGFLFNSYYEAVGPRHLRAARGHLSRPGVAEIGRYRAFVDRAIEEWLATLDDPAWARVRDLFVLGLHHEQQHQELILTDIKHVFAGHPEMPVYQVERGRPAVAEPPPLIWRGFEGGLYSIGAENVAFAFDNEGPRHRVFLEPFRLASRPVTCGEYQAFIADGGYRRSEFWLSDGWALAQAEGWRAPLYWREEAADGFSLATLSGRRKVRAAEPVAHVSYYEADAYARWAGKRLPGEAEWEVAAAVAARPSLDAGGRANLLSSGHYHPRPAAGLGFTQMLGDVWEWTASAYQPYPGFRAAAGAIGEYNGKFMSGQMVLRGGSCVTPDDHIRASYRNFFPPAARWQFSGIRLAEDAA